jgi:hypothetical protein
LHQASGLQDERTDSSFRPDHFGKRQGLCVAELPILNADFTASLNSFNKAGETPIPKGSAASSVYALIPLPASTVAVNF